MTKKRPAKRTAKWLKDQAEKNKIIDQIVDNSTKTAERVVLPSEGIHPLTPVVNQFNGILNVVTTTAEVLAKSNEQREDLSEARYTMKLRELVPKYLLVELYKITGNECIMCAVNTFLGTAWTVNKSMQSAINKFYLELFSERVSFTSCSACMRRRLDRIRAYLLKNGAEPHTPD